MVGFLRGNMVDAELKKRILKNYYSLKYPGSFQGISVFRKSLKENSGIEIGYSALRRILKSSLPYQVNVVKRKKFQRRPLYSKGVTIEGYCDPIFIPYATKTGEKKNFNALVVCDVHSRYLWTTPLEKVNPKYLKAAFLSLFRNGLPYFAILRCDRDKSLNALANTFFAKRDILLLARRSLTHMGFLEGIIRNIKRKMMKSLRMTSEPWTQRRLQVALREVTHSYNHTESSSHGMKPAECNFPEFDPVLRAKLYGNQPLEKFETLYTQTLERQKKANSPRKSWKSKFKEGPDDFKKGDIVYINFEENRVGRKAYEVQRGKLYRIARVNVLAKPYLYKLFNMSTEKEILGWYHGHELAKGDLSDLEIERVVKERKKKTPSGKKLIYVKYKGLDDSFNRWIEKS